MFIITPRKAVSSSNVTLTHICCTEYFGRGVAFYIFSAAYRFMADTFSIRRSSVKKQLKIPKF